MTPKVTYGAFFPIMAAEVMRGHNCLANLAICSLQKKRIQIHTISLCPTFSTFCPFFSFSVQKFGRAQKWTPPLASPLGSLAHGMVSIRPATIDDLPGMQACVLDAGWGSWVRHDPLEDGVLGCFLDLFGTPTPCHIIMYILHTYIHIYI